MQSRWTSPAPAAREPFQTAISVASFLIQQEAHQNIPVRTQTTCTGRQSRVRVRIQSFAPDSRAEANPASSVHTRRSIDIEMCRASQLPARPQNAVLQMRDLAAPRGRPSQRHSIPCPPPAHGTKDGPQRLLWTFPSSRIRPQFSPRKSSRKNDTTLKEPHERQAVDSRTVLEAPRFFVSEE